MTEISKPKIPEHMTLTELINQTEELLEIKDSVRLVDELTRQNSIFHKLQRMLASESECLAYMLRKESEVELYCRRYYEGRLPPKVYQEKKLIYPATTKAEVDLCVKSDPVFNEIKTKADEARKRVEFLESTIWRLKERGREIDSIIQWRKFVESGA